jgi:hypothetical protein
MRQFSEFHLDASRFSKIRLNVTLLITNFITSFIVPSLLYTKSRVSSVGIATGYGLDDWMIGVRFPAGAGNFSLHYRVQNGSGTHPASCPMGTGGSFCGDKAAGV